MSALPNPPPEPSARLRWDHVDWLRGLAVILMFQTHLYDAFVQEGDRSGAAWLTTRHLGGFPARMFLFLAGVSLVLRFAGDRRRGVPDDESTRKAAMRGLEVLALGLAFRVTEWVLGGAALDRAGEMLRVDILNVIGVSLAVAALVCRPAELGRRVPWVSLAATAAIILGTPFVELSSIASAEPRFLWSYLAGDKPMAFFPFFPWAGYTFAGVFVGVLWLRAGARGRLGLATLSLAVLGLGMAGLGQLLRDPKIALYSFGDNTSRITGPNAFIYRMGVVLALSGVAFLVARWLPERGISPMRLLGRTSLLMYWVHVELVYGHTTKRIYHGLSFAWATVALVLLCVAMVALAWWRLERWPALWERIRKLRWRALPGFGPAEQ